MEPSIAGSCHCRPIMHSATDSTSQRHDPVLNAFLEFLARDITSHPERLQAVDTALLARIDTLTRGIDIDLDQPLAEDDE